MPETDNDTPKVAIVTGASQGLGEGIARGYRARGWRVVGVSRSITPADEGDWLMIPGSVAEPDTARQIVATALDRFGRVDTLVNNAGVFIGERFTDYTADQYRQITQTNLDGFFHMTQAALPSMVEQGSGHVVQIVTTLAEHANAEFPSVLASMTKGGLAAATRSLAIEYASRGIRANAVSPGPIRTELGGGLNDEFEALLAGQTALGRVGEPDDVGRVVAGLLSGDSGWINAQTIEVAGGYVV